LREGVYELRLTYGKGIRISYEKDTIILLLLGFEKSAQNREVKKAIAILARTDRRITMASRPYKTSHYLKKPQDRAAYLNDVLESGELNITPTKNIPLT